MKVKDPTPTDDLEMDTVVTLTNNQAETIEKWFEAMCQAGQFIPLQEFLRITTIRPKKPTHPSPK